MYQAGILFFTHFSSSVSPFEESKGPGAYFALGLPHSARRGFSFLVLHLSLL